MGKWAEDTKTINKNANDVAYENMLKLIHNKISAMRYNFYLEVQHIIKNLNTRSSLNHWAMPVGL